MSGSQKCELFRDKKETNILRKKSKINILYLYKKKPHKVMRYVFNQIIVSIDPHPIPVKRNKRKIPKWQKDPAADD